MELDELKKSWNALDEQLKKEPIADEKQIAGMIAEYKANARKSIGRLTGWQRFSIGIADCNFITHFHSLLALPLPADSGKDQSGFRAKYSFLP